jgi:type IV pilus assembly protein PilC
MTGAIIADNDIDLEMRLKQIGLELIDYRELGEKKSRFGGRIKINDMIILCLHLEQLMKAGVPILDAIADVRDSTESPRLRDVMAGVYESLKSGETLSQAMAKYPRVFNDVFVGLVRAGEKTGSFAESFAHLAEHLKWTSEIRRKVRKAVTYPIGLIILMTGVITILMMFVVPKLIDFITSQGFDIPIHTRALMWVSAAFVNYWYLILGTPVVLLVLLVMLYRNVTSFAYNVDNLMLHVPVLGNVTRKINIARFTHFFAVMFNSGIDILEALNTASNVVSNLVIRESIEVMVKAVSEGTSMTSALKLSNQFPNLVVRMFKVGEDSGNMHDALENINFFYNREVNDGVEATVGMIQPVLTIVMGCMIFWVISAVFGPLYQSFSKMKF